MAGKMTDQNVLAVFKNAVARKGGCCGSGGALLSAGTLVGGAIDEQKILSKTYVLKKPAKKGYTGPTVSGKDGKQFVEYKISGEEMLSRVQKGQASRAASSAVNKAATAASIEAWKNAHPGKNGAPGSIPYYDRCALACVEKNITHMLRGKAKSLGMDAASSNALINDQAQRNEARALVLSGKHRSGVRTKLSDAEKAARKAAISPEEKAAISAAAKQAAAIRKAAYQRAGLVA